MLEAVSSLKLGMRWFSEDISHLRGFGRKWIVTVKGMVVVVAAVVVIVGVARKRN